ncbi:hypothetical protein PsorP6_014367 [Peronosclerospora sorghi]|uniref:Uncharacterized protein n=1 Tax=Peronosclerospora sorghi TaxID=230839 RepID=A0ACC0VHN7_9STRA|nr:hypothetical protein PsorP6_014367 [Peronosclerospora sorghi]
MLIERNQSDHADYATMSPLLPRRYAQECVSKLRSIKSQRRTEQRFETFQSFAGGKGHVISPICKYAYMNKLYPRTHSGHSLMDN